VSKFKMVEGEPKLFYKIAIPELNDEREFCCISFDSVTLGRSSYLTVPGRNVVLNPPDSNSNFLKYTGRDLLINFPD
jgi:hypothetical protein